MVTFPPDPRPERSAFHHTGKRGKGMTIDVIEESAGISLHLLLPSASSPPRQLSRGPWALIFHVTSRQLPDFHLSSASIPVLPLTPRPILSCLF